MLWSLVGAIVGALPAYFVYRFLLDSGRLDRFPRISGLWVAGGLLFGLNALVFLLTGGLFMVALAFSVITRIPVPIPLVGIFGVTTSLVTWMIMRRVYQGGASSRALAGLIGSAFYILLGALMGIRLVYFVHDSPDNPMAGTAEMIVFVVSIAASISCLTLMAFPTRSKRA